MSAVVLVLGDAAMAGELQVLVESRGGAILSHDDVESGLAAASRATPAVVVVGAQLGAAAARAIAKRCEETTALASARVVLIGSDDVTSPGGEPLVVARRDCFATVGALLRFDPALRVPVQILARYELMGEAAPTKRLGNVIELGVSTLTFDADQALPDLGTLLVTFVVPGGAERVRLTGVLEPPRGRGGPRDVRLEGVDDDARRCLRRFIEKRLVRTPAEVL